MAIIPLALVSCKTIDPTLYTQHCDSSNSAALHTHDTLVLHDSIYIREFIKGDTVYRDRVEYRDRWRTRIVHDTIRDTQIVEKVIEHPPEKYIPPFYKHCTTILWIILAAAAVYVVVRFKK